ncbi:MAG: hypothetical protein JWL83_2606 [Actinomycetia bacterium]|nr:hypothetical protein [Actinomycetes bacterium]
MIPRDDVKVEPREHLGAAPSAPARSGLGLRRHPSVPLSIVLAAFVASTFLMPTLVSFGVSDDFLYAHSVDQLVSHGNLVVFPATAATLLFQVAWGAAFTAVFGHSFAVLRVATLTMTVIGAVATYALARELRVDRVRSALGTAACLFNPIAYVLAFTFMTDDYLVSLIAIATYAYARALRRDVVDGRWMVAGSAAASAAFLVRHQGALVSIGVLTYLLVAHRLHRDRATLRVVAQAALLPFIVVVAYTVWYRVLAGTPANAAQLSYFRGWTDAGAGAIAKEGARIFFLDVMFVGLFVLPFGLAALPRVRVMARVMSRRAWVVLGAIFAATAIAAVVLDWLRMPYVPQFLNIAGLGPSDLRGGRYPIFDGAWRTIATVACAAATATVLLAISARLARKTGPRDAAGVMVVCVLAWQALAVLGPSMVLRNGPISYDRYFLPMLPLAVCAALWALRDVEFSVTIATAATVVVAAFSVGATHDFLDRQAAVWRVARDAHASGIAYSQLDAGAAWDGYHLYEFSVRNAINPVIPRGLTGRLVLSKYDGPPWWIGFYAPALRGDYIVASDRLYSYDVLRRVKYSSWLDRGTSYIYLLRHPP